MRSRELVMSGVLVAVVGLAGWFLTGGWALATATDLLRFALGVAALATIPWRHRLPWEFAVIAVVVAAVSEIAAYLPLVGVFVVGTRRRPVETVAITLLTMGGTLYTLIPGTAWDSRIWVTILSAWALELASVAAGLLIGSRRALLAQLRGRVARAERERAEHADRVRAAERRRIAEEMHDLLGHRLSLLAVHAGALALRSDLSAATVRESATVLRDTTHRAMEDLRTVVQVLREPGEGPERLDPPGEDLTGVEALVADARTAGAEVRLRSTELLHVTRPPEALAAVAYRVVREGLTNAARHAPGAPVDVTLEGRRGRDLTVTVVSGRSDDRPPAPAGAGSGLVGLRERVETLTGGTLTHGPLPGGYRLAAVLPWKDIP
ncbi:sensor histidine kinase [Pseudonocardia phyllosphaerae]|uniref:sensor histidine kinase n=1 Tax=Pseudonocardia phyllosphaerae TaxID=3390502 RepID=UPI00397A5192